MRTLLLLGLLASSGCVTMKLYQACESRSAIEDVLHCSVRQGEPGHVSLAIRTASTSRDRYWDFQTSVLPGATARAPGVATRGEDPLPGSSYTVLVAERAEEQLLVRYPLERRRDPDRDEVGPADLALGAILVEHGESVDLWIPPRNGRKSGPDPTLAGPWVLLERDRYEKSATTYSTAEDEHVVLRLDVPEESYWPLFVLAVPFTVLLDVATSPVQAILLIIIANSRFM